MHVCAEGKATTTEYTVAAVEGTLSFASLNASRQGAKARSGLPARHKLLRERAGRRESNKAGKDYSMDC